MSIIFYRYNDTDKVLCDTFSTVNTRIYFCSEPTCNKRAHVAGGRCDKCFKVEIARLKRAHNPHRCSGEIVDDGYCEYFLCDERDDPLCPQYK